MSRKQFVYIIYLVSLVLETTECWIYPYLQEIISRAYKSPFSIVAKMKEVTPRVMYKNATKREKDKTNINGNYVDLHSFLHLDLSLSQSCHIISASVNYLQLGIPIYNSEVIIKLIYIELFTTGISSIIVNT